MMFQSTLPTRGSDVLEHDSNDLKRFDVSIHAPHEGERRPLLLYIWGDTRVSIHAPHEGERH